MSELSDDAVALVAAKAMQRPTARTLVVIWQMGGAIANVPPDATAFAARTPPFMVAIDGFWTDPADSEEVVGWVRSTWREVAGYGTGAGYTSIQVVPESGHRRARAAPHEARRRRQV